jgi:phytoene dehydrogenase-like protein
VERKQLPGGRAGVVHDGFTFDIGPTVLTMPGPHRRRHSSCDPRSKCRPRRSATDAAARTGVPGVLGRRQHDQRALDIDEDLDRGRVYLPKIIFDSLALILLDEKPLVNELQVSTLLLVCKQPLLSAR